VRVLVVRGNQASPWELETWRRLPDRFDIAYLQTDRNRFDLEDPPLRPIEVSTLAGLLPHRRASHLVSNFLGDRYLGAGRALEWADVVHGEELDTWFSAQVARWKRRYRFRLVQTVWETIPQLGSYRTRPQRTFRGAVMGGTDLYVAVTQRARDALLLEGIAADRIRVSPPGLNLEAFRVASQARHRPEEHVVVSPGRLVWEKGHQDVLRAMAALRRGLVGSQGAGPVEVRAIILGTGKEEARLRAYARELGVSDRVEFRGEAPYADMPRVYAEATCMVLASLPRSTSAIAGGPRFFWEEQFGMVLPEAMAAGLPIVASCSGAIPEVAGSSAMYFAPGDWRRLAELLVEGPLSRAPGTRVAYPEELLSRYSSESSASRLEAIYDELLAIR
jgi:glycosyltransferase involved in cell wall biosynthesis